MCVLVTIRALVGNDVKMTKEYLTSSIRICVRLSAFVFARGIGSSQTSFSRFSKNALVSWKGVDVRVYYEEDRRGSAR